MSVKDFGARGDGVSDDTKAIQDAIDHVGREGGGTVLFPKVRSAYRTMAPIVIRWHKVRLAGESSTIEYHGPGGAAITYDRVGRVFPQWVTISNLYIVPEQAGASGVDWGFSCSKAESVHIRLKQPHQTGLIVEGDPGGTGAYENIFEGVFIQGQGDETQDGVVFTESEKPYHRAPNSNLWISGRVGQVNTAFRIAGANNTFLAPTTEGTIHDVFVIDDPLHGNMTPVNTGIYNAYVEGSRTATVFRVGPSAYKTTIVGPCYTGIGTVLNDNGKGTLFIDPARTVNLGGASLNVGTGGNVPVLVPAPSSSRSRCTDGAMSWDKQFFYVCEGSNGWLRFRRDGAPW